MGFRDDSNRTDYIPYGECCISGGKYLYPGGVGLALSSTPAGLYYFLRWQVWRAVCSIVDSTSSRNANRRKALGRTLKGGGRTVHYQMGRMMAADHPFGVGLNNFPWYFHEYAEAVGIHESLPYNGVNDAGAGGQSKQSHALYGLTLAELGWPGLVIMLAVMVQWLYLSGRLLFVTNPDVSARIGGGCFFGFLAEFVGNSTEITFRNQQIFLIFNVLLGFTVAVLRALSEKQRRATRHGRVPCA